MPEESPFTSKKLGEAIARILQLQSGDEVEVLRDKLNRNRVMVIRKPANEESQADRQQRET